MDEDEFEVPKKSLLKQLRNEDLEIHSIDVLDDRIAILKSEIMRTEHEKTRKKTAHVTADSLFD